MKETTPSNVPVTVNVLGNDFITCDPFVTLTLVDQPEDGTAVVTADDEVLYTPSGEFVGTAVFQYSICADCEDGSTACDTATVTIIVTPPTVEEEVIAQPDVVQTPFETPITIEVLNNDIGNDLQVVSVIPSPIGLTTVNDDGTITYTPAPGFVGVIYFFYNVCNAAGTPCDMTIVSVTVLPPDQPNLPPNAGNDIDSTEVNVPVIINVLANDSDPEGGPLTVTSIVNGPDNGTATIDTTGTITYTPDAGFTGNDGFTYSVCDSLGLCDTAIVAIAIGIDPADHYPIAVNDEGTTPVNTPITIPVLQNNSDPDGDPLTVTLLSDPANGTIVLNPDGTVTYTPNSLFEGTDYFTYAACDDGILALCDTAYVTITVGDGDDSPIAQDDVASTLVNTPVEIDVLANDFDPNFDQLIVTEILDEPTFGTVQIDPDGLFVVYTPFATTPAGTVDTFTYVVCEQLAEPACDTATVIVFIVNGLNPQPDVVFTEEDTPINIPVLDNDEGCDLTVTAVTDPENGTAVLVDSTVTYTPDSSFIGTDNFFYTVCDCTDSCEQVLVTVNVIPDGVNLPPIANNDTATTPPNTPVTIPVMDNDFDPNGDTITVTGIVEPPTNGTATIDSTDNTITYTPNSTFVGCDLFSYVICDTGGLCDTAFVQIGVGATDCLNLPPLAQNDAATTDEDAPVTIEVLDNNSDPDTDPIDDPLVVTFVSDPTNGTATLNPDGTVTYTPDAGFNGTDQFIYVVCDSGTPQLCDTASVTITINAVADSVLAQPDIAYTNVNDQVDIDVLDNDFGEDISITEISVAPDNGIATILSGEITYIPATDFVGTDYFIYEICNPDGICDTTLVTVIVLPDSLTNLPPYAVNDVDSTGVNTEVCLNVLANDSDPLGGNIIFINSFTEPANGVVFQTDDSTFCYLPDTSFVGVDTFTYVICDDGTPTLCDTATVVISIGTGDLPNNPPLAVDDLYNTPLDTPIVIDMLDNNSDPDGDNFIVTFTSVPANGTLTLDSLGIYTYAPDTGFVGTDYFSYVICDDGTPVLCDTAYVTIIVGLPIRRAIRLEHYGYHLAKHTDYLVRGRLRHLGYDLIGLVHCVHSRQRNG